MDIEEIIKEILEDLLGRIDADYTKITVEEGENSSYDINIKSDNPSLLIGHHGDNIQAIQHILKVLLWKKTQKDHLFINMDIDDYRKRQEENAIALADRKADTARKTGRKQFMPPMSSSIRRKIHLHFMGPGFEDIETFSEGEREERRIVIKLKS